MLINFEIGLFDSKPCGRKIRLIANARKNISNSLKGTVPHNKGVPANKYTCAHCNKSVGGESNFRRWHGDNCKSNPASGVDVHKPFLDKIKGKPKPKVQCKHCDKMSGGMNNLARHQSSCQGPNS